MKAAKWIFWSILLLFGIAILTVATTRSRTRKVSIDSDFERDGTLMVDIEPRITADVTQAFMGEPTFEMPPEDVSDDEWLGQKAKREQYKMPPLRFSGYDLVLCQGRYISRFFSDVIDLDSDSRLTRGRYIIEGDRLTLIPSKSRPSEVLLIREIDGVKVLMESDRVTDEKGKVDYTVASPLEFLVSLSAGEDWSDVLRKHPAFAKWYRQ